MTHKRLTRRLTRIESQAETRQRLIDAAAVLFERQGFHKTTLGEIAAEAAYTTGAVYSNFERKEDIALEVLSADAAAGWVDFVAALAGKPTAEKLIVAVLEWRVRALAHHSALATLRLELSLPSQRNEVLRQAVVVGQEMLRTVLADYLEQVAADFDAELRVDSAVLAASILGIFDGTAIAGGVEPESPHHEAFAFSLAAMIVGAFDPSPIPPDEWPKVLRRLITKARKLAA